MKTEIVIVESKIKITYEDNKGRKLALKDAVYSPTTTVYSSYVVKPIKHSLKK